MTQKTWAGFEEIDHTADLELKIWGEDIALLFEQAALGMKDLLQVEAVSPQEGSIVKNFSVEGIDMEGLLVSYLSELLFYLETENLVVQEVNLNFEGKRSLDARISCQRVSSYLREIKAVTYHNLEIRKTEQGWTANLVFDI